jgi:hypothetical protein
VKEGEDLHYFGTLRDIWRGAWEIPKSQSWEENPSVDQERMRGNRSCSPETWHSERVESVDSLELTKPGALELPLTVDLTPQSILNDMISDIVILTKKSTWKDLACGFKPWSLRKVV